MIVKPLKRLAETTSLATGNWIAVCILTGTLGFGLGWVLAYYRVVAKMCYFVVV